MTYEEILEEQNKRLLGEVEQLKKLVYKLLTNESPPNNIETYYVPRVVKRPYKHSVKSRKGNVKGTKHSFHRTKSTMLEVTFPSGTIAKREQVIKFDTVESAKVFIRHNVPMLRDSALTNISSAVNGVSDRFKSEIKKGHAYGLYFRNIVLNTEEDDN